jgi:hypothetical protein
MCVLVVLEDCFFLPYSVSFAGFDIGYACYLLIT